MTGLRRSLSLLDATLVNVGVMIGSAVFLTASDVARALPQPLLQLAVWAVAALLSLAGALTIAELGAAFPKAGGLCVYLREALGPFWGFFYGWALLVVIQTAAIAAVAVAFASYCGHFLPLSPRAADLVAIAAIAALTGINVLGVREGVWTQNVVTGAKVLVVGGLIAAAFLGSAGSPSHFAPSSHPWTFAAFGAAAIGPLFAFDGWITTSYIGGEIKSPGRNLPLAALLSIALVTLLYLGLNAGYLYVLGSDRVAASPLVAADTARALLGPRGADLAAGMVVLATVGGLNGNILGGARVLYAMAASIPDLARRRRRSWRKAWSRSVSSSPAGSTSFSPAASSLPGSSTVLAASPCSSSAAGPISTGLIASGDIRWCRPRSSPRQRCCS